MSNDVVVATAHLERKMDKVTALLKKILAELQVIAAGVADEDYERCVECADAHEDDGR